MELPPGAHDAGSGDRSTARVVNDRYALKLFRRMEDGPNPSSRSPVFSPSAPFRGLPLAGVVSTPARNRGGRAGMLQGSVRHQGRAGSTRSRAQAYYERVSARVDRSAAPMQIGVGSEPTPFFTALAQWYLLGAATSGSAPPTAPAAGRSQPSGLRAGPLAGRALDDPPPTCARAAGVARAARTTRA